MEPMNIEPFKYCLCGRDHGLAVLMVDVESELIPRKDARGNWLYYCLKGHHVLPVLALPSTVQDGCDGQCQEAEATKEFTASGRI